MSLRRSLSILTFAIFGITSLTGCATSNLTSFTKQKVAEPYVNVVVVFVETNQEITQFNEEAYNTIVRKKFNNLSNIDFRKNLENAFVKNMGQTSTLVTGAGSLFEAGDDIDYASFIGGLKKAGAEAVLVVNMNKSWSTTTERIVKNDALNTYDVVKDANPNASYLCYLIDLNQIKPVWMGKSTGNGVWMVGYNTLNNNLAKNVNSKLNKEGFVY